MTNEDNEGGGIVDRIKDTVSNLMGGGSDTDTATGSDAVADVPTDVAGAANDPYGGSGGAPGDPQFGPSEGGISDVLPGGRGLGTDEDDTMTDRLSPNS